MKNDHHSWLRREQSHALSAYRCIPPADPAHRSSSFPLSSSQTHPIGSAMPFADRQRHSNGVPSTSTPDESIGNTAVGVAPLSDQVEILQRESDRIHDLVARRADRMCPVLFQPFAQRVRLGGLWIRHPDSSRRSEAAPAAARPECSAESICRASPARSGWRSRSPSECSPARAVRGAGCLRPVKSCGNNRRGYSGCRSARASRSFTNV